MPTRRAVRPDATHHRNARRQRITREVRPGHAFSSVFWLRVFLIALLAVVGCAVLGLVVHAPGKWLTWATYGTIAALVVAMAGFLRSIKF